MKLKPIKTTDELAFYAVETDKLDTISLFEGSVPAGFTSPADEAMDLDLNLHDHLVRNPSHTFCVKALGESM